MGKAQTRVANGVAGGGREEPIYATIHAILNDHIVRGVLPPGLVLGQANVARAFNVSRVPAGIALSRLCEEGLLQTFEGRGYIVPDGEPLRIDLADAGLRVPEAVASPTPARRAQIYADVEHIVAACLAYGRFMLNESALAQAYNVSRTIAHEVLAQLERLGIVEQDSNNRWYAGPMSASELEHHFEIRWLLEPQALRQAYPLLKAGDIAQRLRRIKAARKHETLPMERERLEADLHVDILALCPNTILLDAVRRSQRILIATHSAFANYQTREEIMQMASDHVVIYEALAAGDIDRAASMLEAHLRRSLKPNVDILQRLGPLPESMRPAFLVQVK